MTQNLARAEMTPATPVARIEIADPKRDLDQALARASKLIAPLWPLESFVAVNPFLGLSSESFERACQRMRQATGANVLMPRAYYRRLIDSGRITESDLEQALSLASGMAGAPTSVEALLAALEAPAAKPRSMFATVADVLDRNGTGEHTRRVVEDVSKWCSAFWDDGQAAWRMPWRQLPLYAAWRAASSVDRAAEVSGLAGFRRLVASLPQDPVRTIETVIDVLDIPHDALDAYLHRALSSIGGWASYARYLGWTRELEGKDDDTLIQLLAIRLAWDYALYRAHDDATSQEQWRAVTHAMAEAAFDRTLDSDIAVDAVLQGAYDAAFRRETLHKLKLTAEVAESERGRPSTQAAFCIDVRSEVFRRALETVAPEVDTIGFAGFFGVPIEYVPIGQESGPAQCPVLLTPKYVVRQGVSDATVEETTEILGLRLLRRRAAKAWKSFKSSAVSSFVYVETAGLGFAAKLIGDAAGWTRTVADPNAEGLDKQTLARTTPEVLVGTVGGRKTGFGGADQVALAEGALRGMSLTENFARLVMLTGHGSTMVNNPHAAGYDCGACGGHPGDANARVAATLLNDPKVRRELANRGISIPDDTVFIGGLHDTTLDQVTIFDRDRIPASHQDDLAQLEGVLAAAGAITRAERASLLSVRTKDIDAGIERRSRDWSQVRPEWGLARNAAFIAAPRSRTRGVDLQGRAFLHDYDWTKDTDFSVLELILTAPMVVATWINLQYYGSSVNQEKLGSGNKVLHNVVGTLGVLEGNGGDLRVGLPHQAVHNGQELVHEPLRLNVFVEAPKAEIDRILGKHPEVQELLDNGWLHLVALDDGRADLRDPTEGKWAPLR